MDNSLHHRFGKYLAPLNLFLQCYGVDLHQLSPTSETHRNLIRLWGWVFLLIQIVGTGGQFINRIPSFTMNVENINRLLSRTNMLVTCLMTTSFIFFKAASRIVSFINSLQMIDRSLNRPDLSSLYRSSIIGVLWILITVNFECGCAVLDELTRSNANLLHIFQQAVRFQVLAPLMATILIYAICAQILVIYYQQLAIQIEQNNKDIVYSIQTFVRLQNATDRLHDHFLFKMKLNTLFCIVNLIQTVYNLLIYGLGENILLITWNTFAAVDLFFRLWVICHSADYIRDAALNCARSARNLRIKSKDSLQQKQRKQIILFIYEVNQQVIRTNQIPLGRNITFQFADYIFSFALILWQSKDIPFNV